MTMVQPWATILVLPAMISMLGSYMICREEQDDTLKSLLLMLASGDRDHILSGVFNQFLSEKSEPAE